MINSCEFSKMQEGKTGQDRGRGCHFCDVLDDIPERYTMSLNGLVCFVVILASCVPIVDLVHEELAHKPRFGREKSA